MPVILKRITFEYISAKGVVMAENTMDQDEVNALLNAVDSGKVAFEKENPGAHKKFPVYNFRNPNYISKEIMHIISAVHENFARTFSFSLSGMLRSLVQIDMLSIDQLTFDEFTLSLPEYTCLNVVSMQPFEGTFIVEVNLNVLILFIERLLGGEGSGNFKERLLTELEKILSIKIIKKLLAEYKTAWNQVVAFEPKIEKTETDPRFIKSMDMHERVLLVCFEVKVAKEKGIINICFPYSYLEPILRKLVTQSSKHLIKKSGKLRQSFSKMQEQLLDLPFLLHSVLTTTVLPLNDILDLKKGDIIRLNMRTDDDISIMLDNNAIYRAKLGLRSKRKISIITKRVRV
ncbi:MAG: flagellar motor switch protein FliM [Candidatus Omnitrophota bacterium]|nr:MAG: flagellar motor switch protein FliM [Candidatus Omnitrophota bacterium]